MNRRKRITGTEENKGTSSVHMPKEIAPSLKRVALSLASASRPKGSRNATLPARNSVSTRPSDAAPAARSTPIAGSATATPEIMNTCANCEAAIAATRRRLSRLVTRDLGGDAAIVLRRLELQAREVGFQALYAAGSASRLDDLDGRAQRNEVVE